MKKIENIFFIITIFINALFFSTITFTGGNYNLIIQTNYWNIFKFMVFLVIVIIFLKDLLGNKKIPLKVCWMLYSLALLIVLTISSEILFYGSIHPLLIQDILIFGSRAIPVFLVGILIVKRNKIDIINRYTQVVTLYTSLALLIAFLSDTFISGSRTAFGGVNYQATAYVSAMMLGLNLYYAFINRDKETLFPFLRSNWVKWIHISLSIVLLLNTFQTGGRGGAVVSIGYIIFTLIYILRKSNILNKLSVVLMFVAIYIVIKIFLDDPQFIKGFERAFSFLGKESIINLENSNRDTVFITSINHILESPIYGYGLGSYYNIMGFFPHNLFLLILFEGGLIYLIIFFIFIISVLRKMLNLIKMNKGYLLIVFIVITNFILLMFSSTYIRDDITWLLYGIAFGSYYKRNQFISENITTVNSKRK